MAVEEHQAPIACSPAPAVTRPEDLEDAACWPVTHLAALLQSRQVSSLELTKMYLERLHRYQPLLNCTVTFLDELALAEAAAADAEIAAGRYRGTLHGIPWGAKDIIAVAGHPTTWGSAPFEEQVLDYDATVVTLLREAGAVLIAKLTTGELAGGDRHFNGQTMNPWNPHTQGSSGSSAVRLPLAPRSDSVASAAMLAAVPAGPRLRNGCRLRRVCHRDGDIWQHTLPLRPLRPRRAPAHARPSLALRRDGTELDPGPAGADVPVRGGLRDGLRCRGQGRRQGPCRENQPARPPRLPDRTAAFPAQRVAPDRASGATCSTRSSTRRQHPMHRCCAQVTSAPFNWDGAKLAAQGAAAYLSGLRVGYIADSFELEDETAMRNAQATLELLREAGVAEFIPIEVPETTTVSRTDSLS